MLIIALVMAVIGLAALVTAVVTSNEVIAWVCIGASVIGVVLLIVDAMRERRRRDGGASTASAATADEAVEPEFDADYPDEAELSEADLAEADRSGTDLSGADAEERSGVFDTAEDTAEVTGETETLDAAEDGTVDDHGTR